MMTFLTIVAIIVAGLVGLLAVGAACCIIDSIIN